MATDLPKRDESRDLLIDAYGSVTMVSRGAPFDSMIRSVTGRASKAVRARYSPTIELEAALKRVGELALAAKRHLDASTEAASLLPEQDTKWPDGYDFEYLEKAQTEDMESARVLREMCEFLLAQTEKADV
jgi:hypothetical protein